MPLTSDVEPTTTKQAQPAATPVVPARDHSPAIYGAKEEVRSLAARIMNLHPSAKEIGNQGALLLAQLGIALGLNPLPGTGHISAWLDKDGKLCVHIGLEGRMSLARRESSFSISTRPMRAEEIEEHGLTQGDRGAIAELFRHDLIREMTSLGLPVKPVPGIGIATKGEYVPKGKSLAWRASQRAIKDALRLAYSFKLPSELVGVVKVAEDETKVPSGVIEGDFDEVSKPKAEAGSAPKSPIIDGMTGEVIEAPSLPALSAPAAPKDKNGLPKTRLKSWKEVRIKTGQWKKSQEELIREFPTYANANGKPNSISILNALAAEGWSEINDNNVGDVLPTIRQRVADKAL